MLQHLTCANFRNLSDLSLDFRSGLNIIYGNNGAGKTSVLEAIYYLFHGKSFRTNDKESMIAFSATTFSLFAKILQDLDTAVIGVSKLRYGNNTIKFNGEKIRSISQVANVLPVKFIPSIPQSLIVDGPKERRAYLDWGVFHVEHDFHKMWQDYSKAVASRNSLLKLKIVNSELTYWDEAIVHYGQRLHAHRINHLGEIVELFNGAGFVFANANAGIGFDYRSGWDDSVGLAKSLEQCRRKDLALGYTSVGVHRADLQLTYKGGLAADTLSAGQLKLLTYRLHLVQGMVLKSKLGKDPLYLIDDLGAELDVANMRAVLSMLADMRAQHIISCLDKVDAAQMAGSTMFHVEHGALQQIT
jgi:DNA replication and repair protein RecF